MVSTRTAAFVALAALFACAFTAHAAEREYFWNEVTNTTQWEEPNHPVAFEDSESGKKYYVDPKTGESVWEVSESEKTSIDFNLSGVERFDGRNA